jgi:cation/acetate symporter
VKLKGKGGAPNNMLSLPAGQRVTIEFLKDTTIDKITTTRKPKPGDAKPASSDIGYGSAPGVAAGNWSDWNLSKKFMFRKGESITLTDFDVKVVEDGKPVISPLKIEFGDPSEIKITTVNNVRVKTPNAPSNEKWLNPFGPLTSKHGYPMLYTYSLIIALVCGTAGLPHILVRFYTNPDGKSAKRTTLWVMVMLGAFYVFTPIWGSMGRMAMPALYASNTTDAVVITLPGTVGGDFWGAMLKGITSAGAFAAFMSTFSGLLVSMSSAFAHDIYGKMIRPESSPESRLKAFKYAAVGIGVVSMALGLLVESFEIAMMVGWAFAIGAASYFPLLLLGSWWRGLTARGAGVGMLVGGLASLVAIVTNMLLDKKYLTFEVSPLARSLMEQPAIWGVPLSLTLMVVVSKATHKEVPENVDVMMLRLHAPEALGYSKDYID